MKHICLIICYLIIIVFVYSNDELEFERLNSNHGLSSEEIRNIFQDSEGYMWFLTKEGLNRYDGYNFKIFKPGVSNLEFTSSSFESICEDEQNRLWLGTAQNGLIIFDKNQHKVFSFEELTGGHKISDLHIRTLLADRNNRIWIGTEYGLYCYDIDNNSTGYYNLGNLQIETPVWCIIESMIEDVHGNIWIGTWNMGLYIIDAKTNELNNFLVFDASSSTNNRNRIKSLYEDSQHNIWVGTWEDGLYKVSYTFEELTVQQTLLYDNKTEQSIPGDIIYSIAQDKNDNLWIGTPYGLSVIENLYSVRPYYNNITYEFGSENSLSNNEVWKIYKDRSGLIWIGTLEGGVNKVHPQGKIFEGYNIPMVNPQINSQTIHSFCYDDASRLLVGVKSLGFGVYDLENNFYYPYLQLPDYGSIDLDINTVTCMVNEDNRYLWLGTRYNGLVVFEFEKKTFVVLNQLSEAFTYETVNSIHYSYNGIFWVGTDNGLYKIQRCDDCETNYIIEKIQQLNNLQITTLCESDMGFLWIGTSESGIYKLDDSGYSDLYITKYDKKSQNCPTDRIQYIFEDSKGKIWIGSSELGLLTYNSDKSLIQKVNISQLTISDMIFGITEDLNGNLWLTTNRGLLRLVFNSGQIKADSYTIADGLQGNIFVRGSIYKQNNNRIFIGGYHGFNAFFPSSVKPNTFVPLTIITEIMVNDSIIYNPHEKVLELTHKQNNISFSFSANSFYKADKNSYATKLEGLQEKLVLC